MMSFNECCDLFLLLFGHNLVLLVWIYFWHLLALLRSYFVIIHGINVKERFISLLAVDREKDMRIERNVLFFGDFHVTTPQRRSSTHTHTH